MKTNEAPEKIYLSAIDLEEVGHLLTESNDRYDVEYVRTDAFIEKACEWLEPVFKNYAGYNCGMDLVEDFKKYIGE